MCLPQLKSHLLLRIGLALLALANIANYVVHKAHGEVDFLTGLLFGFSFGLLMLAMWRDRGTSRSLAVRSGRSRVSR